MTNISPVSPEVEASVLAEWRAFAPMLERMERPAESRDTHAVAWIRKATANIPSEVATTVRVLGALGIEPEEIARITTLGTQRVRGLLGISEEAGW
jgi:hypothetical protein